MEPAYALVTISSSSVHPSRHVSLLVDWLAVRHGRGEARLWARGAGVLWIYGWSANDPLPIPCPEHNQHHEHFICKLSIKRCDETYEQKGCKFPRFYSAAAAAGVWARCARATVADKLAAARKLFDATDVGGHSHQLLLWKPPADTAAWAAKAAELCKMLCKLNIEYRNLTVHANKAATKLAPSPCHALRGCANSSSTATRTEIKKAVFLAHFPVKEKGGVPASPLASSAPSMVFLKNTMGVNTSKCV
ncbi:hypothetical protein NFJ02_13g15120 [Pycnococcus provasolii]